MIEFPDVSRYDIGWEIPAGTPAVVARSTLSRSYVDPTYPSWRDQAARLGARFGAYHWLNHGHITEQAAFAFKHAMMAPMMIDAEDMPGNTGFNGPLTVSDLLDFTLAYRSLGGTCNAVYLPRWYWSGHMGSPSLEPLVRAGLHLVASNYSGTGGWAPYGGMIPFQLQYTSTPHDMNRFIGTIDEWWAIFNGDTQEGTLDMLMGLVTGDETVYIGDGLSCRPLDSYGKGPAVTEAFDKLESRIGKPIEFSSAEALEAGLGRITNGEPPIPGGPGDFTFTGTGTMGTSGDPS